MFGRSVGRSNGFAVLIVRICFAINDIDCCKTVMDFLLRVLFRCSYNVIISFDFHIIGKFSRCKQKHLPDVLAVLSLSGLERTDLEVHYMVETLRSGPPCSLGSLQQHVTCTTSWKLCIIGQDLPILIAEAFFLLRQQELCDLEETSRWLEDPHGAVRLGIPDILTSAPAWRLLEVI